MNSGFFPNNENLSLPNQGFTPSGDVSILPGQNNTLISRPEYADNIFYLNIGKHARVYFSYPDSLEWRDRIFEGIIKAAGRDYLILTQDDGKDLLLWLIYINYAEFDEDLTLSQGFR